MVDSWDNLTLVGLLGVALLGEIILMVAIVDTLRQTKAELSRLKNIRLSIQREVNELRQRLDSTRGKE